MSQYIIEAGTGQHIGDREEQQDRAALLAAPRAPGYMMAIVADGMGGMSGGALAAEQVIRTAKLAFDEFSPQLDDVDEMLQTIARDAHTIIRLTGISSDTKPHSTMVALVIAPTGTATWVHIGDSRLYRFRGPNCTERTMDHSYAQSLVNDGRIHRDAAQFQQLSNMLVNALGTDGHDPEPSIGRCDALKAGDSFLLCSDGLWQYFTDAELGTAIAMQSPREAAEMLVNKARHRSTGSLADNCTLAIVKLVAQPKASKNYSAKKMRRAI